nr:uncharacterized protein LOC109778263 [Aegilops tauschii subsp. strangulata]XP_045088552.1 uncharacterized protein LOC109778263 [Aegilops tauschii subsp. strangulata]
MRLQEGKTTQQRTADTSTNRLHEGELNISNSLNTLGGLLLLSSLDVLGKGFNRLDHRRGHGLVEQSRIGVLHALVHHLVRPKQAASPGQQLLHHRAALEALLGLLLRQTTTSPRRGQIDALGPGRLLHRSRQQGGRRGADDRAQEQVQSPQGRQGSISTGNISAQRRGRNPGERSQQRGSRQGRRLRGTDGGRRGAGGATVAWTGVVGVAHCTIAAGKGRSGDTQMAAATGRDEDGPCVAEPNSGGGSRGRVPPARRPAPRPRRNRPRLQSQPTKAPQPRASWEGRRGSRAGPSQEGRVTRPARPAERADSGGQPHPTT